MTYMPSATIAKSGFVIPARFADSEYTTQYGTLDLLRLHGEFSMFLDLVDMCDYGEAIDKIQGFTVFAPTNHAFTTLSNSALSDFTTHGNREDIAGFVGQFFVPQRSHSSQFLDRRIWASNTRGRRMLIEATQRPTFESARIVLFDLVGFDGTAHVIDDMISGPCVFCPISQASVAPRDVKEEQQDTPLSHAA